MVSKTEWRQKQLASKIRSRKKYGVKNKIMSKIKWRLKQNGV